MLAESRATTSLQERRAPLRDTQAQLDLLNALPLDPPTFSTALTRSDSEPLKPSTLEILQINVGRLCNMCCRHCHVDAGPDRTEEVMDRATAEACLALLDREPSIHTVDITGGAPELNPHFRFLVEGATARGHHVIDRCNLTVLLLPRFKDLPQWLGEQGVEVVCSLPHYRKPHTDNQRGEGTYERSIEALQRLNRAGYGQGDPQRMLRLMTNPAGNWLPPQQDSTEKRWKSELARRWGVQFDGLIGLTNMPIARYLEWLVESDNLSAYLQRLASAFNPATVAGLMCRNTLSVSWDGRLFDCDFNQMLDLEIQGSPASPTVHTYRTADFQDRVIRTDRHCFGCTAGRGSSCGGSTT